MRRGMFTSTNAARSFIANSSSPSLPSRISEMSTYTIGCVIGSPPIVAVPAQLVIMLHVATLGLALLVMSPPIVQVAALPAEGGPNQTHREREPKAAGRQGNRVNHHRARRRARSGVVLFTRLRGIGILRSSRRNLWRRARLAACLR